MSISQSNYFTESLEQNLITEVPEFNSALQSIETDSTPAKYVPLYGAKKWVRYIWHPTINILSLIGAIAAIDSFISDGISWTNLGILLFMFNLTGLAGEAGMHRLFAHKSYRVAKPLRILLAIAGTMVGEAPILEYAAYHRRHHIYADHEGDLHSPHYFESNGLWPWLKNIWHAFIGWKYNPKTNQIASPEKYAKDLLSEPELVIINNSFYGIVLASFLFPFLLGFFFTKSIDGAFTAFLWGGCFRFCVMTLIGDLIIRAGCHLYGTRPFIDQSNSQSRNIWILAIPSLGLSWHNNHHAFPGSALLNFDWWQIDPSGSFITLLEKLGLAWNIKRPSIEQIKSKRVDLDIVV